MGSRAYVLAPRVNSTSCAQCSLWIRVRRRRVAFISRPRQYSQTLWGNFFHHSLLWAQMGFHLKDLSIRTMRHSLSPVFRPPPCGSIPASMTSTITRLPTRSTKLIRGCSRGIQPSWRRPHTPWPMLSKLPGRRLSQAEVTDLLKKAGLESTYRMVYRVGNP